MDPSEIAQIYSEVATKIPAPNDAWLRINTENQLKVTVSFSQKDLIQEKTRTFVNSFTKNEGSGVFQSGGFPSELSSVHIYKPSPSGQLLAIVKIKEDPSQTLNTEYNIEIWDSSHMLKSISAKSKVGFIYNDEWFGGLEWSPDESKIAFAAQPFIKTGVSYFNNDPDKAKEPRGHQYDFVEDWGEAYINKSVSSLFLLDLTFDSINQLSGLPSDIASVGQVTWHPNSKSLAFVGWRIGPKERRLGVKYCYQRHCSVFSLELSQENSQAVLLSENNYVARSPRYSPSGESLVYLSSGQVNTHNTCHQLSYYNFSTKKSTIIIDTIDFPNAPNDFPGLYVSGFASRCFLNENTLLLDSIWYSYKKLLVIDIEKKTVDCVVTNNSMGVTLIDVFQNYVVAIGSEPNKPATVYFGEFKNNSVDFIEVIPTDQLTRGSKVANKIKELKYEIYSVGEFPNISQYIALRPNTEKPTPLVLIPHGGPHSTFLNEYNSTFAFLALLGYTVLIVNFRGSLGFGKKVLESLLGHVGDMDVQDCKDCLDHFLTIGKVDTEKIVFSGGSHSGFLGGHVIAKDKRYKACVIRNPVTNIASMYNVTDIPDWCVAETASDSIQVMFDKSPMSLVNQITTPTLFLIGDQDKRVPPSQGVQMYYALKERGVPTALKVYPKNGHAISKPESESDAWVNAAIWFQTYTK